MLMQRELMALTQRERALPNPPGKKIIKLYAHKTAIASLAHTHLLHTQTSKDPKGLTLMRPDEEALQDQVYVKNGAAALGYERQRVQAKPQDSLAESAAYFRVKKV